MSYISGSIYIHILSISTYVYIYVYILYIYISVYMYIYTHTCHIRQVAWQYLKGSFLFDLVTSFPVSFVEQVAAAECARAGGTAGVGGIQLPFICNVCVSHVFVCNVCVCHIWLL